MSEPTNPPPATTEVATAAPPCLGAAEQIELLQFSIGRYDHYFDAVNNKANFWLAFDSFALGAMVVAYKDFVQPLAPVFPVPSIALLLDVEMGFFIALSLLSIGLILSASFPFNRPARKPRKPPRSKKGVKASAVPSLLPPPPLSSLYYDHVAIRTIDEFSQHLSQLQINALAHDYHQQAHQLAQGLASKYRRLRQAGWVLYAQLAVLASLFFTFLFS